MKYHTSIEISLPKEKAAAHFANRDNLKKWHSNLVSIKPQKGTVGETDSESLLDYGKFELRENVIRNNLPDEYFAEYETKGICWNTMKSTFIKLDENRTRYEIDIEYRFDAWFLKVMRVVVPFMFSMPLKKYLRDFKTAAESDDTL